jgi:GNAT superfamily N-acetyltransferase
MRTLCDDRFLDSGSRLALIRLPRSPERGDYDWFDLELGDVQVGRARCRIEPERFTVFSIMVYPEYQGQGYARLAIGHFQREHTLIVADRVRYDARSFWTRMGFCAESMDHYVWHG